MLKTENKQKRALPLVRTKKTRKLIGDIVCFAVALILSCILIIPFLWMLICSVQSESSLIFMNPPVWPDPIRLVNYKEVFFEIEMPLLFKNTMIIVVSNMVIGIAASISVAYAFARNRTREKNIFFSVLLATMMLPWVVTLVPQYIIYNKINWLGTMLPLIAPSIGGSAFFIFMFRQFLMAIPKDLDEAALIDGCGRLGILIRILLPQCMPIIATMIIFSFNGSWSDYVGPSIYLTDPDQYTLSIGLSKYLVANSVTPWHRVMAGCVLFSLPMIVVILTCQKAFTRGIVASGLKV